MLLAITTTTISLTIKKEYSPLFAHESQLSVVYDACVPTYYGYENEIGDGENEKWYELVANNLTRHFPHSTSGTVDITFYIDDSNVWNDIIDEYQREHVKSAIVIGITKWNNVVFYKHESNNTIVKKKLVNVHKGSALSHNVTISPFNTNPAYGNPDAMASPNGSGVLIENQNGIEHKHYENWTIDINIYDYLTQTSTGEIKLGYIPAHEFGHILGLRDIDLCENGYIQANYHHEELLMGYSMPFEFGNFYFPNLQNRQTEITYKDLVGVAITRGYHTDSDHQWMYDANSSTNGNYKLICSICNGVVYASSLYGYNYVTYKYCNNNHSVSSGNMFAVASYENKDYYKCKYCRYVAQFTDNIAQNYLYSSLNSSMHNAINQVSGLYYTFDEAHTFSHHFLSHSSTKHKSYCVCGQYTLESHAADASNLYFYNGHIYAPCLFCGTLVDLGGNGPIIPVPGSINQMVTDNGSYIMDNGILVIVAEDLEAYLNGSLVFHPIGELTN